MKRLAAALVIAVLITTIFGQPHDQASATVNLPEAEVVWEGGAPFIKVDGNNYAPFMLFINADVELATARADLEDELEYAEREGIKFVSVNLTFPWRSSDSGTRAWYFNKIDTWLEFIVDTYPDAYIFPRIWLGPHTPDLVADPSLDDDRMLFANNELQSLLSLGSAQWQSGMEEALEDGIAHIEANADYGDRVVGYHVAYGDGGEWFQYMHRDYGNDVSPANKAAFRSWLMNKYGTEAAWASAWNLPSIGPNDPAIQQSPYTAGTKLLPSATHQSYIDFAAFTSELAADSLLAAAAVVKDVTNGERLAMAFYGYSFDLFEGTSGHLALDKVLASADIDMLASPTSYLNRGVGGIGAFMTTVDSVSLHGKLWMIEDDMRTYLADSTPFDEDIGSIFPTAGLTIEGHQRNFGSAIVHRTGLWWMDLHSKGWLNDSSLWGNIGTMQQFYYDYMQGVQPLKPDVAIVVDQETMKRTGNGWDMHVPLLFHQRLEFYRSGLSYGLYTLEDVLDGSVPDAQMYVFLNAHYFDATRRSQLAALQEDNRTFVWVYGADLLDTGSLGAVTGFALSEAAGVTGAGSITIESGATGAWSPIASHTYPLGLSSGPFYTVAAPGAATVIGKYTGSGGKAAIVAHDFGDYKSVFVGTGNLDTELLRTIADYAGVHTYMSSDDVLMTDGTFFSIHASSAGTKTLKLPAVSNVRDPLSGMLIGNYTDTVTLSMYEGETRWLVLEEPTVAKRYTFNASFNLSSEGFAYSSYNADFSTSSGVLEVAITNASLGAGPILITPDNLGIDIDNNGYVNIRMRNDSGASVSRIYWTTNSSGTYGEDKTASVAVATNMGSYTNYTFDVSSHPNWSGTLDQLRFDLVSGAGLANGDKIYVEYVEIASAP